MEESAAPAIALNRHELAGAFGDLGTDLPLLLALILINGLDAASAFILFGLFQLLTAIRYGLPMPVQPLKAMAALMIALGPSVPVGWLFGGGLIVGVVMLLLALTGSLDRVSQLLPAGVVRGIQLGLGMTLMFIAFGFMQQEGSWGLLLALVGVGVVLGLSRNRQIPPALLLVAGGLGLAVFRIDFGALASGVGLALPQLYLPTLEDLWNGGIQLALPQIPLSLANSIIATAYLVQDLYPGRRDVTPRKIGLTYALMNLVSPFFSGVPVCHGSGGLAGHHRFGARTGGSVLIYGGLLLTLGLFFSGAIFEVVKVFPFPLLGVLLLFEGFALAKLVLKVRDDRINLTVALLVGILVIGLPYGYVLGMVAGTGAYWLLRRRGITL